MKRNLIVPNYYGYRLQVNNRPLTDQQNRHFFQCLHTLHAQNPLIIYRGEKKDTLLKHYSLTETEEADELRYLLFLMGAKAGVFAGTGIPGLDAIDIAEAGGNEFCLVFRMLGNLVVKEFPFSARRVAMKSFREDQPEVIRYFRNRNNEEQFLQIIGGLSYPEKIMIRDYYLALLHHIGKSDFSSSSFLLSTTLSFSQANKFAWKDEENGSHNPIILMGWVPDGYEGLLSVARASRMREKTKIDKLGLPVYNSSFFPRQEEVTLKGGLLPHYLLGYLYMQGQKEIFEVNPALFEIEKNWNGIELPVDQSSFYERIKRTAYGRYFSFESESGIFKQY